MSDDFSETQELDQLAACRNQIKSARELLQRSLAEYVAIAKQNPDFIIGEGFKPTTIAPEKLAQCRVLPSRAEIIRLMPSSGKALEIGTQTGHFAKFMLDTLGEISLTTIDITYNLFDYGALGPYLAAGRLTTRQGDSAQETASFPDNSFDFIYLDASHHYDYVKADLEAARTKVKIGGVIICNDYTCWFPFEGTPYGVMQAVNEFLQMYNFEVSFFAFHPFGYHDIALKRCE